MLKYKLKNIKHPGTVDLHLVGRVNLADLPEDKLDELYKNGCPFLELTPEEIECENPELKVIHTSSTPKKKKNDK